MTTTADVSDWLAEHRADKADIDTHADALAAREQLGALQDWRHAHPDATPYEIATNDAAQAKCRAAIKAGRDLITKAVQR